MQTRRNCVVGKGFETGPCARCLYCFAAHGASAVFVAVLSDLCGGLPATVGAEGNFALFAFRLLDLTPRASQLIKPKRETKRERENPAGARARARMMHGPAPFSMPGRERERERERERARERERENPAGARARARMMHGPAPFSMPGRERERERARERERTLQVRVRVQG